MPSEPATHNAQPVTSAREVRSILHRATPAPQALYVGCPNIGDREALLRRINEMLDRRWFSNDGPFVKEFEARIAEFLGVKNCIALCNATVALEIASRALDLHGEVIVPSYTFIATAHALQWQEITPVFCDMDRRKGHRPPHRPGSQRRDGRPRLRGDQRSSGE